MIQRVFASREDRNAALARLLALSLVLLVATLALTAFVPSLTDPTWIREVVVAAGPFAPALFIGIQTAQVILAPIPGQALAAVGGYLFGGIAGTAYSMLGVLFGSAVVFLVARRIGRPFVERVVADDVLNRFDDFARRQGVTGLLILFLLPTFPDDALCAIVGLSPVRLRTLLALVAVGRLPTFALAAVAGEQAASTDYVTAAGLVAAALVATGVVYVYRDELAALAG
ncbi:TVP38/TMEM64 family protein [Haloferax sp. S1W]|uniref:TVP38/TMEM64 family protein n=1 Tax=Haloferax sp. S1W TaxID=3377110 RepID=UPI0037C8EB40